MGIFTKRESVDVLDLPDLQRRGLLKLPQPHEPSDDLIDLTKSPQPSVTSPINPPFAQPSNSSESMGAVSDFLSDFASIGAANPSVSAEAKSELPSAPLANSSSSDLTWRVENTEYKIEQLLERIAVLEKKLEG